MYKDSTFFFYEHFPSFERKILNLEEKFTLQSLKDIDVRACFNGHISFSLFYKKKG